MPKTALKDPPPVARRLRLARQKAGLTQIQLGEKVGLRQSRISRIEGDGQLTGDQLRDLCQALSVSSDWVLGVGEP